MTEKRVVGAFRAKTHLSQLLADAQKGIETIVTVRGKPAAKIGPVEQESGTRKKSIEKLIEDTRRLRAKARRGPETLHDLVQVGRRR
jgi:prevent-host-death family protein